MKIKSTLIFIFMMGILIAARSQSPIIKKYQETQTYTIAKSSDNDEVKSYYENYENDIKSLFDGTYQFIVNGREKLLITDDTFMIIEKQRSKKEEVIYNLTPNVQVRILPSHTIRKKNFDGFQQMFLINY